MKTFVNRQIAIEKTLFIEDLTSKLIKHLIGLDLYGKTKTLDNKSSSISLRSKIDLLSDCGMIDKHSYSNLMHIISIRNQFAHNFECNYFEDLPQFIDGIDKPLLKNCTIPMSSNEESLKQGFINIVDQAFLFLMKEFNGVTAEYQNDSEKVKVFIEKSEEKILDDYGIIGKRNRALVLNQIRRLYKSEGDDK